jgi:hypothetical protein
MTLEIETPVSTEPIQPADKPAEPVPTAPTEPIQKNEIHVSPSNLKSFAICPSYLPDRDSPIHPTTEEGFMLHKALEEGEFEHLTPQQRILTDLCISYVKKLPKAKFLIVEKKYFILDGMRNGIVDRVHLDDKPELATTAHVIDWKFGWTKVDDAEHNHQGWSYVVVLFRECPKLERVTVHFLQPRLNYVTRHTFTREDLPKIVETLKTIVFKSKLQNEFNVSESNCIYCCRAKCPAMVKWAETIAVNYDKYELPSDLHSSNFVNSPNEMAHLYTISSIIEKWAGSVKSHAKKMYHEYGLEMPGYEVKFKANPAPITSPHAAYELASQVGVNLDDFLGCCSVSKGELQEKVAEKAPKGAKGKSKIAFLERLMDVGALHEGGETAYFSKIK